MLVAREHGSRLNERRRRLEPRSTLRRRRRRIDLVTVFVPKQREEKWREGSFLDLNRNETSILRKNTIQNMRMHRERRREKTLIMNGTKPTQQQTGSKWKEL